MPVCGIDEAGRGPWAGPVVAAAVILDLHDIPAGLDDSKKLGEARREALYDDLRRCAIIGVGIADAATIDRDNILSATLWAMGEAVRQLTIKPALALVDGNRVPPLSCPAEAIVAGDARVLSIAAASIVAKVTRDRMMVALHDEHPGYNWRSNKGYGTPDHLLGLRTCGVTIHHRRSFSPVHNILYGDESGTQNLNALIPQDS